jgi:hypothetical protein
MKKADRLRTFDQAREARALKGWRGSVPSQAGGHRWHVHVIDESHCGKFLKVKGCAAFGKSRWVALTDLQDAREPRKKDARKALA